MARQHLAAGMSFDTLMASLCSANEDPLFRLQETNRKMREANARMQAANSQVEHTLIDFRFDLAWKDKQQEMRRHGLPRGKSAPDR